MPDKPVTHGWDHRPFGFDPTLPGYWQYVHSSTVGVPAAWNSSTNYSGGGAGVPGDTVSDGVFIYQCIVDNTNVEPGVNSQWARYWIYDVPIFQNSWANSGGTLQAMRYRISIGPPHVTDKDSGAVTTYSDHQLEIQGSVTGGNPSTLIFWLPPQYIPQNELRLAATDDVGGLAILQVKNDGSVWKGLS